MYLHIWYVSFVFDKVLPKFLHELNICRYKEEFEKKNKGKGCCGRHSIQRVKKTQDQISHVCQYV